MSTIGRPGTVTTSTTLALWRKLRRIDHDDRVALFYHTREHGYATSPHMAPATLAVAAFFNPVRRRSQAWVDRRFNGERFDARQEVERFTQRLRAEFGVEDVKAEMLRVIGKTMQPEAASVWFGPTETQPDSSAFPGQRTSGASGGR